jgi:ribonuclease HI
MWIAVVDGELALLDPDVRGDVAAALRWLHEDFREFGASGTVWDRYTIAAVFGPGTERVRAEAMRPVRLGPDAVLLTYAARGSQRVSLRTSVWVRTPDGWRLLHHQGTPVPGT